MSLTDRHEGQVWRAAPTDPGEVTPLDSPAASPHAGSDGG